MMKALSLEQMELVNGGIEVGLSIQRKIDLDICIFLFKLHSDDILCFIEQNCKNEEEEDYVFSVWDSILI
jgi:hypothetical protein